MDLFPPLLHLWIEKVHRDLRESPQPLNKCYNTYHSIDISIMVIHITLNNNFMTFNNIYIISPYRFTIYPAYDNYTQYADYHCDYTIQWLVLY